MAQLLYATKMLKEGEEPTAKKITDKSIKSTPKERDSTGPASATGDKTKKALRPQTARVVTDKKEAIKPTEDKKEPEGKPRQSLKPPAKEPVQSKPKAVIPKTGMKSVMGKQEEEKKSEKNDVEVKQRPSTAKPAKTTRDPKIESKLNVLTKKPEEEKKEEKKKIEEKKTPAVVKTKAPVKTETKTDTKTEEKKTITKAEIKVSPKIDRKIDVTKPTLKPVQSTKKLTE